MTQESNNQQPVIEVSNLTVRFGNTCVLNNLNLVVEQGELLAIIGGSGSGKTTLLRQMMLLDTPTSGVIKVKGNQVSDYNEITLNELRRHMGVCFQQSALFSALTVLENITFVLREHSDLSKQKIIEIALLKIATVGLPTSAAHKYPSELSGGMQKRAALARALALDPSILFLDEPTAGLDPHSADQFDDLILHLKATLNLTIIMVTHDLDSMLRISDRVAFLANGEVIAKVPMQELVKLNNPEIQSYFSGPRAKLLREREYG